VESKNYTIRANDFASHYCISRGNNACKYPLLFEDVYTSGRNPNITTHSRAKHCR